MAINIQSGSTWAEIRAQLNNKALDKAGDNMFGVLGINNIIADAEGQTAIETDSENKMLKVYGENIGQSLFSEESFTFELLPESDGVASIELPSKYIRGMCTIKCHGNYLIWFSNFKNKARGFFNFGDGTSIYDSATLGAQLNEMIKDVYIEDKYIKIVWDNSFDYKKYTATINWEVW